MWGGLDQEHKTECGARTRGARRAFKRCAHSVCSSQTLTARHLIACPSPACFAATTCACGSLVPPLLQPVLLRCPSAPRARAAATDATADGAGGCSDANARGG